MRVSLDPSSTFDPFYDGSMIILESEMKIESLKLDPMFIFLAWRFFVI
jgi:hypothetical protein